MVWPYSEWIASEGVDWEANEDARRILNLCPLCDDPKDRCSLCYEKKKDPDDENDWATTDPRDHEPVPPVEELSSGRYHLLLATGHKFEEDASPPKKRKPTSSRSFVRRNSKLKSKPVKRGTKVKAREKVKYSSDGYRMDECEWEISEQKILYRPPGYGPDKKSIEANLIPHCTSCHLKPCIVTTMESKMEGLCRKHLQEDQSNHEEGIGEDVDEGAT